MSRESDAVLRYYRCFRERDREGLRALLTPDFHHVGSFGEHTDRDEMIERIWPGVGRSWAEDIAVYGDGGDLMVHYTIRSHERPPTRMAERLRFRGDRIAAVEVFIGRAIEGAAG